MRSNSRRITFQLRLSAASVIAFGVRSDGASDAIPREGSARVARFLNRGGVLRLHRDEAIGDYSAQQ